MYVVCGSSTVTVFRELLQNADDACATECELRFATNATVAHEQCPLIPKPPTPDVNAMLTQWTFRNNGKPFSGDDWHRLRVRRNSLIEANCRRKP